MHPETAPKHAFFRWISDPFGLKAWDDSLLTSVAKRAITCFTVLLFVQAVFDLLAWTAAWGYVFSDSGPFPFVLGFVMTVGILIVDRMLIVHDTEVEPHGAGKEDPEWKLWIRRHVPIAVRAAWVIGAAAITAIPLQLRISNQEIEEYARGNVRQEAIAAVEKRYGKEVPIASAQMAVDGSIPEYQRRRFTERQERSLAFHKDEERKIGEIELLKKCAEAEAYGDMTDDCYTTGADGEGGKTRRKERLLAEAKQEFAARQEQFQKDIAAFDEATSHELERLRRERDADIERIRSLAPDDLVAAYAPDQAHLGIRKRYGILQKLELEDDTIREFSVGCHAVMILIGLLVLLGKLLAPEELKNYYSLRAQAVIGNPEAQQVMKSKGRSTTPEGLTMFRLIPDEQKLVSAYEKARQELAKAVLQHFQKVRELCQPLSNGLCRIRAELAYEIEQDRLKNVVPKIEALNAAEEALSAKSIDIFRWPEKLACREDPRDIEKWPSDMTEVEFERRFGWRDPSSNLNEFTKSADRIVYIYHWIFQQISSWKTDMFLLEHVPFSTEERRRRILQLRQSFYRDIQSRRREVEEITASLNRYGQKVPQWPYSSPTWEEVCMIDKVIASSVITFDATQGISKVVTDNAVPVSPALPLTARFPDVPDGDRLPSVEVDLSANSEDVVLLDDEEPPEELSEEIGEEVAASGMAPVIEFKRSTH